MLALAALTLACGGADPPSRIVGSPGPPQGVTTSTDAGAGADVDAGPAYRDPAVLDGGCTAPNMVCAGKCVATSTAVDNCGACGNACAGPTAACIGATCTCEGSQYRYCATTGCLDVTNDTSNCGDCGVVCDPAQFNACVGGQCTMQ